MQTIVAIIGAIAVAAFGWRLLRGVEKGNSMKHINITTVLVLLALLLGGMPARGMQPGPDIIRECPKCAGTVVQNTMMSGNTFGARMWTDGKMEAPMLPDCPWLVKCPDCHALLWIDETREIGEGGFFDENPGWPNAKEPVSPMVSDLLRMLATDGLSPEKNLYLRQKYWWAINDAYRSNETATAIFEPLQERMLRALAAVFDENDSNQRIAKAEVFRELKMFDDCIRLLSSPFAEKGHAEVAAFIKKLAEQKVWTVKEIKRGK